MKSYPLGSFIVHTRREWSPFIFSMGYITKSISCIALYSQREKDATFFLRMDGKVKISKLNSKALFRTYSTTWALGLQPNNKYKQFNVRTVHY
jgi:hypothetical protein